MSKFYPINVNVEGRKCVIVGGGAVAYRKACSLRDAGARVVVVSPELCDELLEESSAAKESHGIYLVRDEYDEGYLEDAFLVIGATDDESINRRVSADAQKFCSLVNIVDVPDLCTFIVPAVVKRGDLAIGISTAGASPALARKIREDLEEEYGPEYDDFTKLLSKMRSAVLSEVDEIRTRRRVFKRLVEPDMIAVLRDKGYAEAEKAMWNIIDEIQRAAEKD